MADSISYSYRCRRATQTRCFPYDAHRFLSLRSGANVDHGAGFPDPFAVATVGGEQTHTTSVIKKTLNPYWNEIFDLYAHVGSIGLQTLLMICPGRSTKTASSRSRYSTRRSLRRRTKASWASSTCALEMWSICRWAVMVCWMSSVCLCARLTGPRNAHQGPQEVER
jgi:hypothetical protein